MSNPHIIERDRSYGVRQAIVGNTGRDGSGVARTLRMISNYAEGDPQRVEIPAGTVCHVRTSNAGFSGIICTATPIDGGPTVHGASLGAFEVIS